MEPADEVALFVDLENITTSLWRIYQQTPDPFHWMEKARQYGPVAFARAYGDFSQSHLARLENDLRASGIEKFDCPTKQREAGSQSTVDSNIIIDLFEIGLDRPGTTTFLLLAGDSDYVRVVTRLRNRLEKTVVISGVPGSVSRELVRAAGHDDPLNPLPGEPDVDMPALIRLIDSFERTRRDGVYPVFTHLLRYVTDTRNAAVIRPEFAQATLTGLVEDGILEQESLVLGDGQSLRVTRLDRTHPTVVDVLGAD